MDDQNILVEEYDIYYSSKHSDINSNASGNIANFTVDPPIQIDEDEIVKVGLKKFEICRSTISRAITIMKKIFSEIPIHYKMLREYLVKYIEKNQVPLLLSKQIKMDIISEQ